MKKKEQEKHESLALVKDRLERLSSVREQTEEWSDSEQEEEDQSCVFKTMEGLEPFFLANRFFPVEFSRLIVKEELLLEDLNRVIETIDKDGFSPSPYLYVREEAEFVDAAALALRLMLMVGEYINKTLLKSDTKWTELLSKVSMTANKAYEFILKNAFSDKQGIRWAGTELHAIKKTSYCNVYFTQEAVRSLVYCVGQKEPFSIGEDEKTIGVIKDACRWLLARVDDNTIFGDEGKTKGEINNTFYGLNGLFESYNYLEERQKKVVLDVFTRFVEKVNRGEEELSWLNYIDVPLKGYPKPIIYDDRSGSGNILTVLCKGRDIFRDESVIDKRFFEILALWYRSLVNQIDPNTLLWDQGRFLICLTARAIEGLLYFSKYGEPVKYELSEQQMLEALKKTLASSQIQQIFLREISKLGGDLKEENK
ncbi:MAG: hypothetical protein NT166_04990 [Candidatus Aminicenantes bacterium]|nr:hypothetical protein [Candidatus Aminicenantes bacterium]